MTKKEPQILISGMRGEVSGKEMIAHFGDRIADLGLLLEGKGLKTVIDDKQKKLWIRKLNKYKWWVKHINAEYLYHLTSEEIEGWEFTNIEPYELQVRTIMDENARSGKP